MLMLSWDNICFKAQNTKSLAKNNHISKEDSVKLLWSFQLTNSKVFLLALIGSVDSDHRSTPVKGIQAALPPLTAASAMIFLQVCQSGLTLLHCSFLRSAVALHSDLSAYSMLCCLLAEHHPHSEEAVKAAPAPRKRLRP